MTLIETTMNIIANQIREVSFSFVFKNDIPIGNLVLNLGLVFLMNFA